MRRKIAALAAGALLVAVPVGCGKPGSQVGGVPAAAKMTPANAVAFLEVVVDPSVSQKRDLLGLVQKFPIGSKQSDFASLKDQQLSRIFKDSGLDYVADVKPWLGATVSVAALTDGDAPVPVIFVAATDTKKASAALDKAKASTDTNTHLEGDYRIVGDTAVIVPSKNKGLVTKTLDQIDAQAKKEDTSLAKLAAFTKVIGSLKDEHVVLAYADPAAASRLVSAFAVNAGGESSADAVTKALNARGPIGIDVHLAQNSAVLQGVEIQKGKAKHSGGKPELTAGLPADTTGALTVFDLAAIIDDALKSFGGFLGTSISSFEDQVGVSLKNDIFPLIDGETVVVAGAIDKTTSIPDLALVTKPTDHAKAQAAFDRLKKAAAAKGEITDVTIAGKPGFQLAEVTSGIVPTAVLLDDRLIVASSKAYAESLAKSKGKGLASTDEFRGVVGAGSNDGTTFQLLVRAAPIRQAIERKLSGSERDTYNRDVAPNVAPIEAVGIKAIQSGDLTRFEIKVAFK